jgi:hypothetical protein
LLIKSRMHRRLLLSFILTAPLLTECSTFQDKRTPSGDFCSDMPVLPAGQVPDKEYHRLQPVQSDPECRTEAERLESLRKAACKAGADAVIEAANEEVRQSNAGYALISSGTAVTWVRRTTSETKPIPAYPTHGGTSPSAEPSAEPEALPHDEEPPAAATATPAKSGQPSVGPAPAKSGQPSVGPAGTAKPSTKPGAKLSATVDVKVGPAKPPAPKP